MKSYAKSVNRMVLTFRQTSGVDHPFIFRSYDHLEKLRDLGLQCFDRNPGPAHQVEIWKIARATSAAPTYFKPPVIEGLEYIDGGFGANSPSRELLLEIQSMNNNAKNCMNVMLSVGTGKNEPMSRLVGKGIGRYLNTKICNEIDHES